MLPKTGGYGIRPYKALHNKEAAAVAAASSSKRDQKKKRDRKRSKGEVALHLSVRIITDNALQVITKIKTIFDKIVNRKTIFL